MIVSEILHTLPPDLEWMVLFNLTSLSQLADEMTIKAMYRLPSETNLSGCSHIILANTGHFLASSQQPYLIDVDSGKSWSREEIQQSLFDRFRDRLTLFPVDEADCLGLGKIESYPPVLLHVKIQEGFGNASAVFEQEPSQQHYELLRAVGVQFLGGSDQGHYYLAQFQNRLPVHIHAGFLSHFSRTGHCNVFFLQHGAIDPLLEDGLLKAAAVRIAWAEQRSFQAIAQLAQAACQQSLAMTCQPPPPDAPFSYGDLVPLGFVMTALNRAVERLAQRRLSNPLETAEASPILEAHQTLRQFLYHHQQGDLWAFHRDRLVTATDSALILQGLSDPQAVEALEFFADGEGGYYPQLWSGDKQPGKMVFDESCRHWCQADFATTCMVRALRTAAGLSTKTSIEYLAARMEDRSGLYFANPYLVDWMFARSIHQDAAAVPLREQLLAEILASMNEDYSFGLYDVALSTALAILCMAELGFRGRTMRVAQLQLLALLEDQSPNSVPFYSSLRIDHENSNQTLLWRLMSQRTDNLIVPSQKQIRKVQGEYHSLSFYVDTYQMITTALIGLALSQDCAAAQPNEAQSDRSRQTRHPRYQCRSHSDYVAKFALPPYLEKIEI